MFGAITVSPLGAPYQGTWRYGGVEFIDDIVRIEIITKGDLSSNRFFRLQAAIEESTATNRFPDHGPGREDYLVFSLRNHKVLSGGR